MPLWRCKLTPPGTTGCRDIEGTSCYDETFLAVFTIFKTLL